MVPCRDEKLPDALKNAEAKETSASIDDLSRSQVNALNNDVYKEATGTLDDEELHLWENLFADDGDSDIGPHMLMLEKLYLKREMQAKKC